MADEKEHTETKRDQNGTYCAICNKPTTRLCPCCGTIYYCSIACQNENASMHISSLEHYRPEMMAYSPPSESSLITSLISMTASVPSYGVGVLDSKPSASPINWSERTSGYNGLCRVCNVRTTMRCERCKLVYYCSVAHQTSDWPRHRGQCRSTH
jgi:hypothetical protein